MGQEQLQEPSNRVAKLGLGLSGGGFRAAFFHLGVLAQMARQGLLPRVEVISTVSGGSIIGALYYLHLKKLLESKTDAEITNQDFVQLTANMEEDFLRGVQQNPRTLTFADFRKNLLLFRPDYSRSDRIGELYDELFYRPVLQPGSDSMVLMRDLKIFPLQPDGQLDCDFDPALDNFHRQAKVPILLINSTVLNDGHNWRFEAKTMGEPMRETPAELDIDKNFRLKRPERYGEVVPRQQTMELGLAVAASACVPGIFPPLSVSDMYLHQIRVQLVDGGVHDNQGLQGLLDLKCTELVVSDASGQMLDAPDPATNLISVLARTNSILMDRVREEELFRIKENPDLKVALVHLRRGVGIDMVPYINSQEVPAPLPPCPGAAASSQNFRVDPEVQDLLSQVRTDLDSFTEVEAGALMLDGYLMSQAELAQTLATPADQAASAQGRWNFLRLRPWLAQPTPDFLKQLRVARQRTGKIFFLNPWLGAGGLVLVALLLYGLWRCPISRVDFFSLSVRKLLLAGGLAGVYFLWQGLRPRLAKIGLIKTASRFRATILWQGVLALLAWAFMNLHLKVFDPLFLKQGQIQRLKKPA
jgi:NTE family protein